MKKYSINLKALAFFLSIVVLLTTAHIGTISAYAQNEIINNTKEEQIYSNATVDQNFADNRILIMFKNNVSLTFKEYTSSDFSEINCKSVQDMSISNAQRVKSKMEEIRRDNILGIYSAQTSDNIDLVSNYNQIVCIELESIGKENVIDAIKELQKRDDVLYVGPDYEISISSIDDEQYIPSDYNYPNQWAAGHIQLPETWNLIDNLNKSTVTVGVLDTGIDGNHGDLSDIIDKDYCYDFTSGSAVKVLNPIDDNGHGTHVAGIIGAIGDNDIYIAGTCWNVELVSLKVFDANGKGYASHLINAIEWVSANTNIKILNFSGGFNGTTTDDDGNYWFNNSDNIPLQTKISTYNGLFVCSAGNSKNNNDVNPRYPANYSLSNMITVGASNNEDGLWNGTSKGTNYGATTVDLFAPGYDIFSLWPNNDTHSMPGTSMATPFVTGVAAILLSINPKLSPQSLKSLIMNNVDGPSDGITSFVGKCVSGGRLNAYKAVLAATTPCTHSNASYTYNANTHTLICPDCSYSLTEAHNDFSYTYNAYTHSLKCSDCPYITGNAVHTGSYVTYDANTHTYSCSVCSYSLSSAHELYVYSDNGEDGVTIKCNTCNYMRTCYVGVAEYGYANDTQHYVSCTCGCYIFLSPHIPAVVTSTGDLYTHQAFCRDCGVYYQAAHSWVAKSYGTVQGYECLMCNMFSISVPGIMQIPSGDEILIASGDENGTAIVLLPKKEDDLVSE